LSDGSSFYVRTSSWRKEGLEVGDGADKARLASLELESEIADATDYAVTLLARREHSRMELDRKLCRKDISATVREAALDVLQTKGLQSDLRFATMFLQQRLRRHPEGVPALRAGLIGRGVDDKVVARALEITREQFPELIEGALRAAAEKLDRKSGMTDEKLARSLARRGFRVSDIISVMHALGRSGEIFSEKRNLS
jgi:regulatory protein